MTTIAYRDGVLAADTAVFCDGRYCGEVSKVTRHPTITGTVLLATYGKLSDRKAIERWVLNGMPVDGRPALDEDSGGIVVDANGVWHIESDLRPAQIRAPFHAEGSGARIALGAMAAGATAEEAVRIAARYDSGTREPIEAVSL